MNRILNHGVALAIGVLTCLTAAAQTPADTNAALGQLPPSSPTNAAVNPDIPGWSTLTNQSPAQNNMTNMLVTPGVPPLIGPGAVGADQVTAALAGRTVFAIPGGVAAGKVPVGPGIPVWGPIYVHPSMSYLFSYATSIESQPGVRTDTVLQTYSAGLLFDLGTHWVLDYTPAYSVYSADQLQDTFSQFLMLRGATTYEDWSFSLSQAYSSTSDSLLETGTQTSQDTYDTSLGAAYQMGSRLALQLGLNQSIRDTSDFNNVDSKSGSVGLYYDIMPQLKTGITVGAGYNSVSMGSSMPFETYQGSIMFQPGSKLSMSVSGGAEVLQFVDPTAPSLVTPIFSAGVQYQLFPDTSIAISGSRAVNPSYFGNEVQITTEVGASIRQKLSPKWSVSLNGGYTTEPLTSIVPQALPPFFVGPAPHAYLVQADTTSSTSVGLTVSYAVVERVALSAYCSINDTTSTQSNFKYTSTQVGFSVVYTY